VKIKTWRQKHKPRLHSTLFGLKLDLRTTAEIQTQLPPDEWHAVIVVSPVAGILSFFHSFIFFPSFSSSYIFLPCHKTFKKEWTQTNRIYGLKDIWQDHRPCTHSTIASNLMVVILLFWTLVSTSGIVIHEVDILNVSMNVKEEPSMD
jgi:hypothetical protein